jgi:hypothetical protein
MCVLVINLPAFSTTYQSLTDISHILYRKTHLLACNDYLFVIIIENKAPSQIFTSTRKGNNVSSCSLASTLESELSLQEGA